MGTTPDLEEVEQSPFFGKTAEVNREAERQNEIGRWSRYRKEGNVRPQTVAQHIASAIAGTQLTLKPLLPPQEIQFDGELLSDAVGIHDIGEVHHLDDGNSEDVLYENKSANKDLREYKKFLSIYDRFRIPDHYAGGPVFEYVHRAYLLQHAQENPPIFPEDAREVMFDLWKRKETRATVLLFELVERLGYVQYAYEQYRYHDNERILVQTCNVQGPRLDDLIHSFSLYGSYWDSARNALFEFTKEVGPKYPNPSVCGKRVWFEDQAPTPAE